MLAWWEALSTLERIFAYIAIPSTVVLVIQTILLLIGLGNHGVADGSLNGEVEAPDGDLDAVDLPGEDLDADLPETEAVLDGDAGLRLFTVRGFIAFFTVFGWSGLTMLRSGMAPGWAVFLALLLGMLSMLLMAAILKLFLRLQEDGTMDIRNAVGCAGSVYLTVPPKREGKGKVNVVVQEQWSEFEAVSDYHEPIRTGAEVTVVGVSGKNTLIVQPK